jgi:ADP-ribosylglycohydrolase
MGKNKKLSLHDYTTPMWLARELDSKWDDEFDFEGDDYHYADSFALGTPVWDDYFRETATKFDYVALKESSINKSHRLARIAGTLVGCAAGDALGAAYEFGPSIPKTTPIGMVGGGPFNWERGEWTDDTSMAIPIAQAIARGELLTESDTLATIFADWKAWASTAKDVGSQTRSVLSRVKDISENEARRVSREHHERSGMSGGNGALMRTAPVALAYLYDDELDSADLTEAARRVAELTHWEDTAGEACIIWTHAIRHAINHGELNLRKQLEHLPQGRRAYWTDRINEAEAKQPSDFHRNGWVVEALQGAWSAIHHTDNFVDAVEAAVRGGGDTDTVAAIAGSLAGAYYGAASIPASWRRILHGWPGMNYRDLVNLAIKCTEYGVSGYHGWPDGERFEPGAEKTLVKHPHDDGVLLGSLAALDMAPEVDAVVSMCRVGTKQHATAEVIEFWVVDYAGENLSLEFTLTDAANTVAELRAQGKTVLLHCYAAHSRTPSTAALYSALHLGVPVAKAFKDVCAVLPAGNPQPFLRDAVTKIAKKKGKK